MFKVRSLSDLSNDAIQKALYNWTGRNIRRSELPRRGYPQTNEVEMVSAEDIELLGQAFARRDWGEETQRNFIRRQLRGRETIRTRADFHKVFSGVRAMNRREGL